MKKYLCLALLLVSYVSCSAEQPERPSGSGSDQGVLVHTAKEMIPSADEVKLNSHADQEQWSVLQPMYEYFTVLPHVYLIGKTVITYEDQCFACYPRVKKMANGEYIMFYHGGEFGTRIWCTRSTDLKRWTEPVLLYNAENITVNGKQDARRYVNMDAVVLPDGEILAVCSYRAAGHYGEGIGGGLKLIRSKDNGLTWSSPKVIYEGSNWEAYLLLLPDQKTIHCYFTDAIPQSRNSGTSLIISTDKGSTWSEKSYVCRQYKYDHFCPDHGSASSNAACPSECLKKDFFGQKIYTDQMPCFRVLNDGKTIAGFLEARLETPTNIKGTSYCKMSMVYNDGLTWKDLGAPDKASVTEGPSRRYSNIFKGGSGYMVTFPQGEVVVSYNVDQKFKMKVLDRHAGGYGGTNFNEGWITPFNKFGYWGCMEADSPQTLVAAIHGVNNASTGYDGEYDDDEGMQIARFWINRRVDAARQSINVDGDGREWSSRQALYLSSPDKTETIFRASYDDTNLYIIVETAVAKGSAPHTLTLGVCKENGSAKSLVKVDTAGKVSSSGVKVSFSATSQGTTADSRSGLVTEIAVPLKDLGAKAGDMMCFYAKASTASSSTSFTQANDSVVSSWQRISLTK